MPKIFKEHSKKKNSNEKLSEPGDLKSLNFEILYVGNKKVCTLPYI